MINVTWNILMVVGTVSFLINIYYAFVKVGKAVEVFNDPVGKMQGAHMWLSGILAIVSTIAVISFGFIFGSGTTLEKKTLIYAVFSLIFFCYSNTLVDIDCLWNKSFCGAVTKGTSGGKNEDS